MKKGIVIEVNDSYVIVLTNESEFFRLRKTENTYLIGSEITFEHSLIMEKSQVPFYRKRQFKSFASVAAIVLVVASAFPLFSIKANAQVYAYVNVDINPSIELSVTKDFHVISAVALNSDGSRVLSESKNLKGKSIKEATLSIVEESDKDGFLKGERDVLISTTFAQPSTDVEKKQMDSILQSLSSNVEQSDKTLVTVFQNSREVRNEAQQLGISPGKYAIYLAAQKNGIPLDMNDVKSDSVSIIAKETGGIGKIINNNQAVSIPTQAKSPSTSAPLSNDNSSSNEKKEGNSHPSSDNEIVQPIPEHKPEQHSSPVTVSHPQGSNGNDSENQNRKKTGDVSKKDIHQNIEYDNKKH